MPNRKTIRNAFAETAAKQRQLAGIINDRVVFKRSGEEGKLLSVMYGQAEVKPDGRDVVWVHVTAVDPVSSDV